MQELNYQDFLAKLRNKISDSDDKRVKIFEDLNKAIDDNLRSIRRASGDDSEVPPFLINRGLDENAGRSLAGVPDANNTEKAVSEKEAPAPVAKEDKNEKLLSKQLIRDLYPKLAEKVFGQDEILHEIIDVLKVAALNIKANKKKPAGNYIFAGPSGVGKTELATALSDSLGVPVLKLNMGEYGQENDVTKLTGAPPGYVGYNEGGSLTNFVSANKRCIVLFDELEKAHPSIDKILLSILDHGNCTDNKGNDVSFTQTIVVCTSNLGAEVEYQENLSQEEKNELRMEYIKSNLRPEIINRFDSIFHFHSLSKEIYKKVAEKFMTTIQKSVEEEHGFSLKYTKKMMDFVVDKSFDPAMGGRPARRFIEKVVIKPLADFMLNDDFEQEIKKHHEVTLDINKDGNIYFKGKNKKILGVLDNTSELIERIENTKFSGRKKLK